MGDVCGVVRLLVRPLGADLYGASARTWLRFHLWPAQLEVADALQGERLVVMLKARQLGMSWLTVAYGLWLMLFQPAATVLFFLQGATPRRSICSSFRPCAASTAGCHRG